MISKENFIKVYAKKIIDNEASLFLGAGFSQNSNLPSWKKLMSPCAEDLGIEISDKSDFSQIAQYYQIKHGRAELNKLISRQINNSILLNETLAEFLSMRFQNIWTTNFDKIIEKSLEQKEIPYNLISIDSELNNISSAQRVNVFKCGGDIQNPNNLFLTKTDYEDYKNSRKTMISFLIRELIVSSFLFIGYSFNDGLIKQQLRNILSILKCPIKHYAIIFNNAADSTFSYYLDDLETNYNINVVLVEDESEFISLINELIIEVKRHYVFISGSFENLPNAEVDYILKLCKTICKSLLDEKYCIVGAAGKNVGNYIGGAALKHLSLNRISDISTKLIITPLPFDCNKEEIKQYRKKILSKCGSIIFIAGQNSTSDGALENSNGTFEEYEIAKEIGIKLIPIASTGHVAKKIFDSLMNDFINYPYLEELRTMFTVNYCEKNNNNIAELVDLIIKALNYNGRR